MSLTASYGLLAHGLIFGALVSLLPLGELRARAALLATGLALAVGIAPLMHGVFGMPSMTLLQLALYQLVHPSPTPPCRRDALLIVLLAAMLYPLSSWLGTLDIYAVGYQPWVILLALIPIAGLLLWHHLAHWLIIIAIDLAGYASGLFMNLWDALLDPLLVLLALFVVAFSLRLREIR